MNNSNFDNIPKPRYVNEYKKFGDVFKPKKFGERRYLDTFIMQSFVSLVMVVCILLINNIDTGLTNSISQSIKSAINWNMNISKALDVFSNLREVIPQIPQLQKDTGTQLQKDTGAQPVEDMKTDFAMPVEGEITSPFGERVHPVFKTVKMHTGIDINGELGTPIKSATDGKVFKVGEDAINGKYIRIQSGVYECVYAHCNAILVKEGQAVKQGEIIGEVGDTGVVSGPHLHFEIHENGTPLNPLDKVGNIL